MSIQVASLGSFFFPADVGFGNKALLSFVSMCFVPGIFCSVTVVWSLWLDSCCSQVVGLMWEQTLIWGNMTYDLENPAVSGLEAV